MPGLQNQWLGLGAAGFEDVSTTATTATTAAAAAAAAAAVVLYALLRIFNNPLVLSIKAISLASTTARFLGSKHGMRR